MLRRLFSRGAPGRAVAPPRPASEIHAVGDIHGQADLLARALERLLSGPMPGDGPLRIVFLGDYVDRGERVRETLELLMEVARAPGSRRCS